MQMENERDYDVGYSLPTDSDNRIDGFLNQLGITRKRSQIANWNGFYTFTPIKLTHAKRQKLADSWHERAISKEKAASSYFFLSTPKIQEIKPEIKPTLPLIKIKTEPELRPVRVPVHVPEPEPDLQPEMQPLIPPKIEPYSAHNSLERATIENLSKLPVKCSFCNQAFEGMKLLDEHHRDHLNVVKSECVTKKQCRAKKIKKEKA